ncbi:MAG: SixA phosphatase family protein [Candidatus Acidiferrales bacterium]
MILYIVRHGPAVDRTDPEAPPDPERPLTQKGIEKTRAAMRGLREQDVKPALLITSPFLRAAQTAEIAAETLGYPREKIQRTNALVPSAEPAELWKELSKLKSKSVMCFGHGPNVDLVIASAMGMRIMITSLKKSGVACLELDSVSPPKGHLLWLLQPRMLRKLGE